MNQEAHSSLAWQTLLFVPADRPAMLRKAQSRGARALVVDLEDAVASDQKGAARKLLCEELAAGSLSGPARVYVRINAAADGGVEDANALRDAGIAGLMVPKTCTPDDLSPIQDALRGAPLTLIPQIESAAGLLELRALLKADYRLTAVAFGGEDFAADIGVARSRDGVELLFPRAWVVLCARAAELPAIDTVYTDISDDIGLRREAALAAQLGFSGKLLIHPGQVAGVEAAFAPAESQVDWARRVLAAAAEAKDAGAGVASLDGAMVDAPVVAQAERILARASGSG